MISKKYADVNVSRCVACGACIKACPRKAIDVWKGCYAVADKEKCVGCGLCTKKCPAGCIDIKEEVRCEKEKMV